MINFVALLGWNPGNNSTREIYTISQLIDEFSLDKLNKSSSVVNLKRLEWFNKMHYSLQTNDEERIELYMNAMKQHLFDKKDPIKINDKKYFEEILQICKGRISTVEKFISICEPFFIQPECEICNSNELKNMVNTLKDKIFSCNQWNKENIKEIINDSTIEISFKQRATILRQLLMNVPIGPPLIEIMHVLGKEIVLERMENYLK